jgi:hypothetical protein
MIYARVHDTENGMIIAMCDSSLINEILEEGDIVINIKDYADFYKGKLVNTKEAETLLEMHVYSANIIGKEAINLAVKKGIIQKANVQKVKNVPYAQAYNVKV